MALEGSEGESSVGIMHVTCKPLEWWISLLENSMSESKWLKPGLGTITMWVGFSIGISIITR